MPRLVVVLPLTRLAVGQSFPVRSWPLHVTIVRPFEADAESAIRSLRQAQGTDRFDLELGEHARFGRGGSLPVLLVEPSTALEAARARSLHALGIADDGEWRPHVTIKGDTSLAPGDRIRVQQLALVTMGPGDRSVLAVADA